VPSRFSDAYGLGVGSNLSQVLGVFDLGGRWVERTGQQLEPKACLLDSSSVCRILITSSSENR